jgi:hypothetical protein
MEFASEMIIKAAKARLCITEIPITLRKDKRSRPPHLRTWRDGWRHLRFMLLYSPTWLFLVPGLFLLALGVGALGVLYPGPLRWGQLELDVHTMILGSLWTILGVQIVTTGLCARVYSFERLFDREDRLLVLLARGFNLERGILLGGAIALAGFLMDGSVLLEWARGGFGPLHALRRAIVGSTLLAVGAQIVFSSFFLSMLTLRVAELKDGASGVTPTRPPSP